MKVYMGRKLGMTIYTKMEKLRSYVVNRSMYSSTEKTSEVANTTRSSWIRGAYTERAKKILTSLVKSLKSKVKPIDFKDLSLVPSMTSCW
jgi:hypothetical protein